MERRSEQTPIVAVRPAQIADGSEIARLTTQLGYESEAATLAPRLSRLLARDDQQFLVAESDGHVVGWIHALVAEYVEVDPFVVIGGLVVDRSHRRMGVGRVLMRHAEEWAAQQGCPVVRLWSSAGRTAAHEFYRALGYANIKTQYSFVKSFDGAGRLKGFVPRIHE
jgi:GNAT superfamily N-acetyltransferase